MCQLHAFKPFIHRYWFIFDAHPTSFKIHICRRSKGIRRSGHWTVHGSFGRCHIWSGGCQPGAQLTATFKEGHNKKHKKTSLAPHPDGISPPSAFRLCIPGTEGMQQNSISWLMTIVTVIDPNCIANMWKCKLTSAVGLEGFWPKISENFPAVAFDASKWNRLLTNLEVFLNYVG